MRKKKFASVTNGGTVIGLILGLAISTAATEVSQFLWGENVGTFLKGIAKNASTVGALTPCSRFVANECVCELSVHEGEKTILEVGAGSGAVTREIVKHINKDDKLDLVEISEEYALSLQRQFGDRDNVSIHCCDILTLDAEKKYDYIVSTLPFTSLPVEFVKNVLEKYSKMIKPTGSIVYVECHGGAYWKKKVLKMKHALSETCETTNALKEFSKKRKIIKEFRAKHIVKKTKEYRNIPPITIYHIKAEGE